MNLGEVIELFREASGRADLCTTEALAGTLNAKLFLNSGSRYLDEAYPPPQALKWYMKDIAINDYKLEIPGALYIESVDIVNVDGRASLEYKSLAWMKSNYSENISSMDSGTPLYWTPLLIGLSNAQKNLTLTPGVDVYTTQFTYDYQLVAFGSKELYNGIMFMPKTDEIYTLEILAQFVSNTLSANSDTNYWSANYPLALVLAAQLCLEKTFRNSEGVAAIKLSIDDELRGMDHSIVRQESFTASQMEG